MIQCIICITFVVGQVMREFFPMDLKQIWMIWRSRDYCSGHILSSVIALSLSVTYLKDNDGTWIKCICMGSDRSRQLSWHLRVTRCLVFLARWRISQSSFFFLCTECSCLLVRICIYIYLRARVHNYTRNWLISNKKRKELSSLCTLRPLVTCFSLILTLRRHIYIRDKNSPEDRKMATFVMREIVYNHLLRNSLVHYVKLYLTFRCIWKIDTSLNDF